MSKTPSPLMSPNAQPPAGHPVAPGGGTSFSRRGRRLPTGSEEARARGAPDARRRPLLLTTKEPVAATPLSGRVVSSVQTTSPSAVRWPVAPVGRPALTVKPSEPIKAPWLAFELTGAAGVPTIVTTKSYSFVVPSGSVKVPARLSPALSTQSPAAGPFCTSENTVGFDETGVRKSRW